MKCVVLMVWSSWVAEWNGAVATYSGATGQYKWPFGAVLNGH